ncbi:MAG: TlyA family RNA methyltransferase, partial [Clostridiales Family XIII bacterium]|nr:TlyA family RNA methyltransferase [Clostridiales Family XIII bacterium]
RVYAFDVGYGQLDWKLRNDSRVVNRERVNIRSLNPAELAEKADFITIDVSFISLRLVLPVAAGLLAEGGRILCLAKPQFEAGRSQVGKKGIVRDPAVHESVIRAVIAHGRENGLTARALAPSQLRGATGNLEFFLLFSRGGEASEVSDADIAAAVSPPG